MHTKILGTGSYLPVQVRSNQDLEKMVETTDQWIKDRTGISERRIAATDESVSTMGYQAALKAIEMAGIEPSELDMIVCGTTSAPNAFPAAACEIQAMLGIKQIPAFDIAAACSGFVYALSVADQFVKTGAAKKVLVIGADVLSRMCEPDDRSTVILFGDGAGAVVIGVSETPGIINTHIYADGSQGDLLKCSFPPRANESSEAVGYMTMKGNDVFKVAVTQLSNVVTETLRINNVDKSEIDWLVPHQANLRIIQATAQNANFPMEKVMLNIERYGNTTAATIPLCLWEYENQLKKGDKIILVAFGGGFTWGSILLTWAY